MATFKNLADLKEYLESEVLPNVMRKEVHEAVTDVQMEMIDKHVYDRYDPDAYIRRRTNGGLQDPRNMIGTLTLGIEGVEYFIENRTRGAGDNRDQHIAPIIEYGKGYTWEYSRIYQNPIARPFTFETMEYLKATLLHVDALKSGLKRHGIKVK